MDRLRPFWMNILSNRSPRELRDSALEAFILGASSRGNPNSLRRASLIGSSYYMAAPRNTTRPTQKRFAALEP
eukprot:scaffold56867_cov40-Attheya_sp.AAC.2